MATKPQADVLDVMVGTRVPARVRDFYERWAATEQRKLGFVIRKVLVDYCNQHQNGKSAKKR